MCRTRLLEASWAAVYRGNCQKWFTMRFTGADGDINIATDHPEFDAWEWVRPERLPELIVPFMCRLYLDLLADFRTLWSGLDE